MTEEMGNGECGMGTAKPRRRARCALRPSAISIPPSAFRLPHSPRRGITLIELLITMTIIAIISAAILGTASAAMENARRSRTRVD